MEPIGKLMKKEPLEFAKTMIKKQFPKLAESDFEIKQEMGACPTCGATVIPEYHIKREQDKGFNRVPLDAMDCFPCQNKKLAVESVERSKRLKSEYLTDQFWIVPPELENATIENYVPEDAEQGKAFQRVINYAKDFKGGERYNLMLRGTYGGGKSHLLKGVAEKAKALTKVDADGHNVPLTVGFMEMGALLSMVQETFNRKYEGKSKDDIIRNVIALDFLVIDDLGTESGKFAGEIAFQIINGRQGKATAYSTNFMEMDELAKRFDYNGGKIVSRLHNNTEFINVVTKDMRQEKGRGEY